MIAIELERAGQALLVSAFLAAGAGTGAAAGKVQADGTPTVIFDSPSGLEGSISDAGSGGLSDEGGIALSVGPVLFFYRGHGNDEVSTPCFIAECDGGADEVDSGNSVVQLKITARYPADGEAMPKTIADAIDVVLDQFEDDGIVDALNGARLDPDKLTVQGITAREHGQGSTGRQLERSISISFYCAGVNLL